MSRCRAQAKIPIQSASPGPRQTMTPLTANRSTVGMRVGGCHPMEIMSSSWCQSPCRGEVTITARRRCCGGAPGAALCRRMGINPASPSLVQRRNGLYKEMKSTFAPYHQNLEKKIECKASILLVEVVLIFASNRWYMKL